MQGAGNGRLSEGAGRASEGSSRAFFGASKEPSGEGVGGGKKRNKEHAQTRDMDSGVRYSTNFNNLHFISKGYQKLIHHSAPMLLPCFDYLVSLLLML